MRKIIIEIYVYANYVSNYYDDRNVESYNLEFIFFVKRRLDELEHPDLIIEWTSNIYEYAYKKQTEKNQKETNCYFSRYH